MTISCDSDCECGRICDRLYEHEGAHDCHDVKCSVNSHTEDEAVTLKAREWLDAWLKKHGLDWETMTHAERFKATGQIPCAIRCWRVGVPTGAKPGERCDECGRMQDKPTFWEKLPLPV